MVAKPVLKAEDQGILYWCREKLGLPRQPHHSDFYMKVYWKDVKYYGEGHALCQGVFNSMDNYYFSKIEISMVAPRKEDFVILDSDVIEIK